MNNKYRELDLYIKKNWINKEEYRSSCASIKPILPRGKKSVKESKTTDLSLDVMCCSAIPFEKHETFQELLFRLIDEKGLNDSIVYKKAMVDKRLFSKIRSEKDYHPSKNTVIQLAFGLELPIDKALDFIGEAGYSLSFSIKFDVVIRYFLEKCNYNILEVNEALFDHDLPLLVK